MKLPRGRRRAILAVLALLSAASAGCSWLVGVSEDPILAEDLGSDAGDEADTQVALDSPGGDEADAANEAAEDAAQDVTVE